MLFRSDNSFIMRFDIADSMRLTDELDNVLDGMRKVAVHIDVYRPILSTLRPDAVELLAVSERMQQNLAQIALPLAMAQEQHRIRVGHRRADACQIVRIPGSALASEIPVVTMGEVLARAPHPMGMENGVLHRVALKPEDIGVVMVQHQHQPPALVATGALLRGGFRVVGIDPQLLKELADPQHGLVVEVGLVPTAAVDPGLLAGGHADAQPMVVQGSDLGSQRPEQRLHLGTAHAMAQGVGIKGLKGPEMVAVHRPIPESSTVLRSDRASEGLSLSAPERPSRHGAGVGAEERARQG